MKRKVSLLLMLLVFLVSAIPIPALAAEQQVIQKEYEFSAANKEAEYQYAPKKITDQGKKYTIAAISYEVVKTKDLYIKREITYDDLPNRQVELQKTFTIGNKDVTLYAKEENVQYNEVNENVSETYEKCTSPPAIPKAKNITIKGKSCNAGLVDVQEEKTTKGFIAEAKFTGAQGTDYYLSGKKVPMSGSGPTWDNCSATIVKYLGLPEQSKVTDGKWTTGYKKEGKKTVRYAQYAGNRPAANYVATYNYSNLSAKVVYDNGMKGEKEYVIKATCTYKPIPAEAKESNWKKVAILIGAGILILAVSVAIILVILRRRKKEEE